MPADSTTRRSGLLKKASSYLGLAVGLAGMAFLTRLIVRDWDDIVDAVGQARLGPLLGALALGMLGMLCIGLNWIALLYRSRHRVPLRRGLAWYFVGQLGKYVPGGIWPVVGRAELAAKGGVPRRVAYATTATSMLCTYLAAGITGAALLPAALGAHPVVAVAAGALVVAAASVGLHPWVTGRAVALAERVIRRPILKSLPSWRDTLVTVAAHVPVWLIVAGSTWAVARALSVDADPLLVVAATPLSWLIGFLIVGLPGGLGVRESVFVALVASSATSAEALSVALLARMVFVAVDTVGAAGATLLRAVGEPATGPVDTATPATAGDPDDEAPGVRAAGEDADGLSAAEVVDGAEASNGTRPTAPVGSPADGRSGS